MDRKIHILYVDDEIDHLHIGKFFLERDPDFAVTLASGAYEAIDFLKTDTYDSIISDYQMPGMNGIMFLKHLKSIGDTTPFIFYTGRGREEVVIEALNNGAVFYLQKTGNPRSHFVELINRIRTAVSRRRAEIALLQMNEELQAANDEIIATTEDLRLNLNAHIRQESALIPSGERPILVQRNECTIPDNQINTLIERRDDEGMAWRSPDPLLFSEEEGDTFNLRDIINAPDFQPLITDLYSLTTIGSAITDTAGNILVSTGWHTNCSNLHKLTPETCAHCLENGPVLEHEKAPGTSGYFRCKNNMWVFYKTIMVGDRHVGNLFVGQFLFDIEETSYALFREHARRYGFDEESNIAAMKMVGRKNRDTVNTVIALYSRLMYLITQERWGYIKLSRTASERDTLLSSVQKSEKKFRRYLNNAPNGIFITDDEGRYIKVNPAVCEITGYSEEELMQMQISDLTPPELVEVAKNHFNQVSETGKASSELVFIHKEGPLRYWSVDAVRISSNRFMGFVQDITRRKQVEESLQQSEMKYRQVVEHANEAIVVVQHGIFVLVNPKTAELTGYPQEDLWHMPFFSFIHPDDRAIVVDRYQKRMRGEETLSRYSFRLKKKNGSTVWVEISAVPIEWEGQPASLNFLIDITDMRHAEDALRESNQKLRILTGLTRHDILNQVTAVQLILDMASNSSDLSKVQEYITLIKQAGDQIEKTIGFTREYENFGTSSSGWQRIHTVIESAKEEIKQGSISILNQIPRELEVYTDPIIRKVFSTLMENAIRHGEHCRNIKFFCSTRENTLIITCEDDGIGIPSEVKDRIFDHGYGKHTGIGLFLSKEILSITGLTISECGVPKEGARFEILVPTGKFRCQEE